MTSKEKQLNIAFIDGRNLYRSTKEAGWSVNHARVRIYLADKYKISEAYYFLGFTLSDFQDLYEKLQKSGFILKFKEHPYTLKGEKKGNVDCEIIFSVMKKLLDNEIHGKVFIVSGDGDYKKLIDLLIERKVFGKILFPNYKAASSLYKKLGSEFFDNLDKESIKRKIAYKKKAP